MESKKLDKTISEFSNILSRLNNEGDNNLVLGGTHAMILHGLKTPRIPGDMDIIIYSPTEKQLETLEVLRDLMVDKEELFNEYNRISFKFEKKIDNVVHTEVYTLDILLEFMPFPENLLIYESEIDDTKVRVEESSIRVRVQSIENIIKAKSIYGRVKDLTDFINLKNLNFNL